MLSNGPGDPAENAGIIEQLRLLVRTQHPHLRHLPGASAAGPGRWAARTEKLKYGHRGANQPARETGGPGRVYITSQNHGYAVVRRIPCRTAAVSCVYQRQRRNAARGWPTSNHPGLFGSVPSGGRRRSAGYRISVRPALSDLMKGGKQHAAKSRHPKKVMVIGSGPIVIGQAAEFDYAGTQACRALKEEGLEVVLVNSNPATIMTDKRHGGQDLHRAADPGRRQTDHRKGAAGQPAVHPGRADRADSVHAAGQGGLSGAART